MRKEKKAKIKKYIQWVSAAFIWVVIWQAAYACVGKDVLLASPETTLRRLLELGLTGRFYQTVFSSVGRIMLGFVLGCAVGAAVAALSSKSGFLHRFFSLPLSIIKATPIASFVILALIWIRRENLSVMVAFLMVCPIVYSNVYEGIISADRELLEMAKAFRLSRWKVIRHIVFPSVLPYLMAAMKVGLGLAWKAGIAGEVIAIPSGSIGTELYNAKVYIETANLFAWTAVVIILSVIIEKVMVLIIDAALRRRTHRSGEGGT